jgi:hypothetical protein
VQWKIEQKFFVSKITNYPEKEVTGLNVTPINFTLVIITKIFIQSIIFNRI